MNPLGLVEVPDCTNVQPWWESSGMTPAVWLLAVLAIAAVTVLIGMWIDGRSKR
jgi:hypothetical protein